MAPRLTATQREARADLLAGLCDGRFTREPVRSCYSCGSQHAALVICGHERFGIPHETVLCAACGLSYTSPRFTAEALRELYSGLYWRMSTGDTAFNVSTAALARGESILRHVASHLSAGPQTVVELGCGGGWNLVAFQSAGHRALGFDLDPTAVQGGRAAFGLDLRVGSEKEVLEEGVRPDLLILSHVLEHVLDPIAWLESLKPLLSVDSLVYVEVPGLRNLDVPSYRADVMNYLQVAHCFNFTRETLCRLIVRAGFEVAQANESVQLLARLPAAGHPTLAPHGTGNPDDAALCEEARETLRYLLRSEATRLVRAAAWQVQRARRTASPRRDR